MDEFTERGPFYIIRENGETNNELLYGLLAYVESTLPSFTSSHEYARYSVDGLAASFLKGLLEDLQDRCDNLTVVLEDRYIDQDYSNLYSSQYLFSFAKRSRYSIRLTLFADCIGRYNYDFIEDENLSLSCVGLCVVNPLAGGPIGKTLINPRFVVNRTVDVCLSEFKTSVLEGWFVFQPFHIMVKMAR